MTSLLFPLWQVDLREYQAVCAHLGVTPTKHVYERLSQHLAEAPFRYSRPRGFALHLAECRLTRWRIAVLDIATKAIFPGHPVRHVLNAAMALHECDSAGYAELARTQEGWKLLPKLLIAVLGYVLRMGVALPWLGWQFVVYRVGGLLRAPDELGSARILITGVGRGLGKDLMLHCLERGAEVVGTVRTTAALETVRSWLPGEAPVALVVADLSRPGALVDALRAAQIPPASLRMAIHSAAVKHDGASVLALPDLRDTFQVNCFSAAELAAWFCEPPGEASGTTISPPPAQHDTPHTAHPMDRRRALVVVSSMGRWHGMHSSAGYNASKAALSIWAESLDMERRKSESRPVSVTIVEPGMFASGMMRTTALTHWLLVTRRSVAARIVAGGLAGKATLRPPFWFALLTWAVCMAGRGLRSRLFARAKAPGDPR